MKPLKEIKYVLTDHKDKLFAEYPIQSLAIFGSYARDEQDENSDLDIMVEFNDKIGLRFVDLAEDLENIIGVKVDLVSRKGIKEKYYQSILPDLVYV